MDRFERLLIEEIPRLRRYARALTGDPSQADDLVQECLERAISRRRLWLASRQLRPWLLTIMHNLHANEVRRAHARSRSHAALREAGEVALGETLAADRVDGVALRDLDLALGTLPEEQRAAVLLVGLEGLSYRDAAKVLSVPIGTLMSRLSRGREKLREALDPEVRMASRRTR